MRNKPYVIPNIDGTQVEVAAEQYYQGHITEVRYEAVVANAFSKALAKEPTVR